MATRPDTSSEENPFSNVASLRAAMGSADLGTIRGFDSSNEAHRETWLALTVSERRALLNACPHRNQAPSYSLGGGPSIKGPLAGLVHVVAVSWMQDRRPRDAAILFDDLLEFSDLPKEVYCNALWVIQNDNSKLGTQPKRAKRYLEACLPHGPKNPAVYFNAACVLFELGDHDGALSQIENAKAHNYDRLENVRDEKLLAPLRSHPRFEAVFAHMDPPEWDDLDAALATPDQVKNLEVRGVKTFPEGIRTLKNLEVLDVHFSQFKEVPVWVTELTKLRKLKLNWNASMKVLPDEILAMPSLRELSFYDSGLGKKYQMAQVNNLLGGFAKTTPNHETRMLHIALLLQNEKVALARAAEGIGPLVSALDSNVAQVRSVALRLLSKRLGVVTVPLRQGASVVVLGKLLMDRAVLSERLARRGMALARNVSPETVAVIVGEQPKGKADGLVGGAVMLALEEHLRDALDAVDPGHLAADNPRPKAATKGKRGEAASAAPSPRGESAAKLGELLMSKDAATVQVALEMMKRGGVPAGVLEELFLAMQNTELEKKARDGAKKLFLQYAPTHVQDAVKKIFARTSIYLSGETKVRSRIKSLARQAKGDIDPVKLALLLLPSRRGFSYLFEAAKKDETLASRALEALRSGASLDLSSSELDELPAALTTLKGLTTLDLNGCHLSEISSTLLSMTDLVTLDLTRNRLETLPDAMDQLTNLRSLAVGSNFLREFPVALFRLTTLTSLDVSTERYDPMRSLPFSSIPEGLGQLTALKELNLGAHHLATLPDDFRKLTKLEKLDLSSGKVGSLPEWLAELPALRVLDLEYAELGDAERINAVASHLKAKGVRVKGLK